MEFRELGFEDETWIRHCRDIQEHPFTALSFQSLYTWREAYGLTIGGDRDFYVVRSEHDGGYYCPCGDPEKCRAFEESLGRGEKILYMTEQQAGRLAKRGWCVCHRDDLSEYIISTAAAALHEGHMSKSFREKCNHMKKDHPYTIREIGPEEMPILESMLQTAVEDPERGDMSVLRSEIRDREALGIQGALMETESGEHAFVLGYENFSGMFTVSIGLHDLTMPPETSMVIVHALATLLDGKYPLMNMEEDLGLEGLRRAKQLYSPVDRLEVFEARRVPETAG